MKLQKLSFLLLAVMATTSLFMSGCKDDDTDNPGGNGNTNGPTITLLDDLTYIGKNRAVNPGSQLRFRISASYATNMSNITVARTIVGGASGNVWDTTFSATTFTSDFFIQGPNSNEKHIFTFSATGADGKKTEVSLEVTSTVNLGERTNQELFNKNSDPEMAAYDVVTGASFAINAPAAQLDIVDVSTTAMGTAGRFGTANGSKFKMYTGTRVYAQFKTAEDLNTAWSSSGAELSVTPDLFDANEEPIDQLVLIKSAQNQKVYVISILDVFQDGNLIEFSVKGETL